MAINKTSIAAGMLRESASWDNMTRLELRAIVLRFHAMEEFIRSLTSLTTYSNPSTRQGEGWNELAIPVKEKAKFVYAYDPLSEPMKS